MRESRAWGAGPRPKRAGGSLESGEEVEALAFRVLADRLENGEARADEMTVSFGTRAAA